MRFIFGNLPRLVQVVVLLVCSACMLNAQTEYRRITLCKFFSQKHVVLNQKVEVEAIIVSAFPHGMYLIDNNCKDTVLGVDYSSDSADPSLQRMNRIIIFPVHQARGVFRGKLVYDSEKKRPYMYLERVSKLRFVDTDEEIEEQQDHPPSTEKIIDEMRKDERVNKPN